MDTQSCPTQPTQARTAEQHRLASVVHVSKLRARPVHQRARPVEAMNQGHLDAAQAKIQALLAKLRFVEEQNHTLRSRCQMLETELDHVTRTIGGSPTGFRPPRPAIHRCQPRPGDVPPPLRFTSRPDIRRERSDSSIALTSARSSGMSSIENLLDSYMVSTTTRPPRKSPQSPNFSRPNPNKLVMEGGRNRTKQSGVMAVSS